MSRYDYICSQRIATKDYPFHALIMTAMRQADAINLESLKNAFPGTYSELQWRYKTPGGFLEGEWRED